MHSRYEVADYVVDGSGLVGRVGWGERDEEDCVVPGLGHHWVRDGEGVFYFVQGEVSFHGCCVG